MTVTWKTNDRGAPLEDFLKSLFVTSATSRGVWGLDALLRCCSAEGMASPLLLQAPRGYDTRLWQWTGAAEDEEELRVGEDDKLCVRRLQRFSGEPMPVRWDCDGGTFVVSDWALTGRSNCLCCIQDSISIPINAV
ncbi:unnamed protein product [Symbiodinium sp. CCMP2592]|nr:unnamed protein product [Symbiodinium sp. CCMP2592]